MIGDDDAMRERVRRRLFGPSFVAYGRRFGKAAAFHRWRSACATEALHWRLRCLAFTGETVLRLHLIEGRGRQTLMRTEGGAYR